MFYLKRFLGSGGKGGAITGEFSVVSSDIVEIWIGESPAERSDSEAGGWGRFNGGDGVPYTESGDPYESAGGGGSTEALINSNVLAIADGGGGGGAESAFGGGGGARCGLGGEGVFGDGSDAECETSTTSTPYGGDGGSPVDDPDNAGPGQPGGQEAGAALSNVTATTGGMEYPDRTAHGYAEITFLEADISFSGKVVDSNGNPVQGAEVLAVDSSTSELYGVATTDSNGDYIQYVADGNDYHLAVQYEDAGNDFNDLSKPYVTASGDKTGLDFKLSGYTSPQNDAVDFNFETIFEKGVSESIGLNDGFFFSYEKFLNDSVFLNDADVKQLSKIVAENFSLQDFDTRFYQGEKAYVENLVLSDEERFTAGKVNSEQLEPVENILKSLSREVSEGVSFQVLRSSKVSKSLNDFLSLQDFQSSEAALIRVLDEVVDFEDSSSSFSRILLDDSVVLDDRQSFELYRAVEENFDLNDSERKRFYRALIESYQVQSSLEFLLEASLNEEIQVLDDVDSVAQLLRLYAESLDLADSDVKQVEQRLFEQAGLTDSVLRQSSLRRSFEDEVVLNDSKSKKLFKPFNELTVLSDEEKAFTAKEFSDSFTVEDFEKILYSQSLSDGLNVLDELERSVLRPVSVEENVSLNDDFSRIASLSRIYTEVLDLKEADVQEVEQTLFEQLTLQSSASRSSDIYRSFAEFIVLSDSSRKNLFKSLLELTALSDDETVFAAKKLDDAFEVEDFEKILYAKDVNEVLNVLERLDITVLKSASEEVSLNSDVSKLSFLFRSYIESLEVNDSDLKKFAKSLDDSVALSDDFSRSVKFYDRVAESVLVSDNSSTKLLKVLTDLIVLSDSKSYFLGRNLNAVAELQDSVSKFAAKTRSESLSIEDEISRVVSLVEDESLDLDDRQSYLADFFRRLSQRVELSDADVKRLESVLVEELGVEEDFSKQADFFRAFSEQVILNDLPAQLVIMIFAEEVVSISDKFSKKSDLFRSRSETLTVFDRVDKTFGKVLEDFVSLSEERFVFTGKKVSESLSIDDALSFMKPASTVATEVEIKTLQKAVANLVAARKAVAELEKGKVSEGSIDKF